MTTKFGIQFVLPLIFAQFSLAQNGISFFENGLKAALEQGKAE